MAVITLPHLVWKPSPNHYAGRNGAHPTGIVIHETEGAYAGAVGWFEQAKSQVSAHFVVNEDGTEVTQMVAYADAAWHAVNANPYTIGIEMAGEKANPLKPAQIQATANLVAYLCHRFGIKPAYTEHAMGGIATHKQLGVFGGGHVDPDSPNWNDTTFINEVNAALKTHTFPANYGLVIGRTTTDARSRCESL